MDFFQTYFPTPSLQRREKRLRHLVQKELDFWRVAPQKLNAVLIQHLVAFSRSFHEAYDAWQEEVRKQIPGQIHCEAGCGNCCHHFPQSVEIYESLDVYLQIRMREDLATLLEKCSQRDRVIEQMDLLLPEQESDLDREDAILQQYFAQRLPCPFLKQDGCCSVYDARPVTCRMYFSLTPAEFCVSEHLLTDKNQSFHVCLPDDLEENLSEISELLPLTLSSSLYEAVMQWNLYEGEGWFENG